MPRQSKPFFRKQTRSWYCSTGSKQYPLGKTKDEAYKRFHELMAQSEPLPTENFTLYQLAQVYLDWVKENRAEATYDKHRHFLESFIASVGKRLKPSSLKPVAVRRWAEDSGLNSTSQATAIGSVQRMLNWAIEQEYLKINPLSGMKKPRQKRRDVVYTTKQMAEIREHAIGPFRDLLDFLFITGCRPKEARTLEARHVHGETVIFPGDESKGETPRVIYLTAAAKAIVDCQIEQHPDGPIFRNARGNPWTKDAIKCRMTRISKKVGYRVIAYGTRHSFATNALINEVDPISVAHLMGHANANMVAEVYSHLAKNPAFLRRQAERSVVMPEDDQAA